MALIKDIDNNVLKKTIDLCREIATRQPSIAHTEGAPRFFGPNYNEMTQAISNISFFEDGGDNGIMVLEQPIIGTYDPQSQNFGASIEVTLSVLFKVDNNEFDKQKKAENKACLVCFKIISYLKNKREQWDWVRELKPENCKVVPGQAGPVSEQMYGATLTFPMKVMLNLLFDEADWL